MSLREYEGFDLVLGEVYGVRVWLTDEYGRLRARHLTGIAQPWRPGVNTAVCHVPSIERGGAVVGPAAMSQVVQAMFGVKCTCSACSAGPAEQAAPGHAAPDESCKCGFYAYTSPGFELYTPAGVVGVIRGTGRTLIGAKGFRSEKAEIVALLDPTSDDATGDQWSTWRAERISANYPDVPLLGSIAELMRFAPIESTAPAPTTDEFWSLP